MAFLHPSQFPPPVYTWGKSLLYTAPRFWFSGHHVANSHWSEVQLRQSWNIKSKNISLIALEPSIVLLLTTWCIIATCLQYDPNHEKHSILGCQWFNVAWNPSRQLVCVSGDNFLMPDSNLVLLRINCALSKAGVPEINDCQLHVITIWETGLPFSPHLPFFYIGGLHSLAWALEKIFPSPSWYLEINRFWVHS